MMIHSVENDIVYLDLAYDEHIALAHSLYSVMADIDANAIPRLLDSSASEAYEFVHSVYLIEASAREAGVTWLQADGYVKPVAAEAAQPVIDISFGIDSSTWRLTETQLRFVELTIRSWSESRRTRRSAA